MTTKGELLKTIKFQCEECMGSMTARDRETDESARNLVKGCTAPECLLFPYRLGKDPWPARKAPIELINFARNITPTTNETG